MTPSSSVASPPTRLLAQLTELATGSHERATARRILDHGSRSPRLEAEASPQSLKDRLRQLRDAGLDELPLLELRRGHRAAMHARRVLRAHHDPAPLGLSAARLEALLTQSCPLPFDAPGAFQDFVGQLAGALGEAALPGSLRLIGTSATLFSLNPRKSPDRYFDSDPGQRSDLDLGLESPALSAWLRDRGAPVEPSRINAGGTIAGAELTRRLPAVGDWLTRWSASLGRTIELVATGDGGPPRWPSVMDVVVPWPPREPTSAR